MVMEQIQSFPLICEGGLNSNNNWLQLSNQSPGMASRLVNYEPSLFGGYRRLSGYLPLEDEYPEVDPAGAEGKILGVFIYDGEILCARKQQSGAVYEFYQWSPGNAWIKLSTGLTLSTTGLDKIRYATFNFDGTQKIIFVDGVNKAVLFDGTDWSQIDSTNGGATYADAGGPQALDAPRFVTVFKNHIFIGGDPNYPDVIAHSAPLSEYDWTAGNGAGQINSGFEVMQIKPFRDENYVFGFTQIKKVSVEGTTFVLKDVTTNLGCIASDSVVEINGDLLFLSQDGFRPISATERNNDIELGSLSKNIQQDVIELSALYNSEAVDAVVIRRKSQVRFFFGTASTDPTSAPGIIGGLRGTQGGSVWEWGNLRGIHVSSCTSGYIGKDEYVIHGNYDGRVYQQEVGSSFNGNNIYALYATPFLDFGDTQVRKTMRTINLFTRPEGPMFIRTNLKYDWNVYGTINPATYDFSSTGDIAVYGEAVYGEDTYGGDIIPIMVSNVSGSGYSVQLTLTTEDTRPSYTIQGIVFEYSVNGRK